MIVPSFPSPQSLSNFIVRRSVLSFSRSLYPTHGFVWFPFLSLYAQRIYIRKAYFLLGPFVDINVCTPIQVSHRNKVMTAIICALSIIDLVVGAGKCLFFTPETAFFVNIFYFFFGTMIRSIWSSTKFLRHKLSHSDHQLKETSFRFWVSLNALLFSGNTHYYISEWSSTNFKF